MNQDVANLLGFSKNDLDKAYQLIDQAKIITVLGHAGPDADTFSSCAAMSHILSGLGKEVETVFPDKIKIRKIFPPVNVKIGTHSIKPDLIITLDLANPERACFPPGHENTPIINIDHHLHNSVPGTVNLVDSKASSACEVLCYLILHWWGADKIDAFAANALLRGILDDSIIFRTQLTRQETLKAASLLVERGADYHRIQNAVIARKSPKVAKATGKLLGRLEDIQGKSVVVLSLTLKELDDLGVGESVLGGLVNFLAGMIDSDVVVLITEKSPGRTKVSMRSKRYNVQEVASRFNGGGHKHAAGFESDDSVDTVKIALLKYL